MGLYEEEKEKSAAVNPDDAGETRDQHIDGDLEADCRTVMLKCMTVRSTHEKGQP